MKNYKISVCMAVYNTDLYLEKSIKSVLEQSYNNLELIIVDDCSTDSSFSICESFSKKDKRIIVLRNNENMGPLYSKYRAIKKASGDILMFIDSDDYYESNALETVSHEFNNYDIDMLMFGIRNINNGKNTGEFSPSRQHELFTKINRKDFLKRMIYETNNNSICTKAIKQDLINKHFNIENENLNIRRGDDKYISLCFYEFTNNILLTEHILYNYISRESGITISQKSNYKLDYRSREKAKDIVYHSDCFSDNDRREFDMFALQQSREQLIHIANLTYSQAEKIRIYKEIKNSSYFKSYLDQLIKKQKEPLEFRLFLHNRFHLLILFSIVKYNLHLLAEKK